MDENFIEKEKNIIEFWKNNKIFQKSVEQRKKSRDFVFYEGPPTANAKPGLHHVLARVFKDVICRYKTMQGFRVKRKAGWDTHGLPVELEIEKKLGLRHKKDIEEYGIDKFNENCRESVWKYVKDWETLTERIGYWLDMKNPYITYDPLYMESVWWILKQISEKGLLYQDYKVVPYCPRCGTALSSHEVAQGYQKIKEPAIFVKFQLINPKFQINLKFQNENPKIYLLVWTTTPWTLPANVAIAVNSEIDYLLVKKNSEYLIIADARKEIFGNDFEAVWKIKGKELVGLSYQPIFDEKIISLPQESKNIYKILAGQFVSTQEGTGLVHIAPAFGEEDMELIKMQNAKCKMQKEPEFPILLTVDEEGKFRPEVKKWAGLFVKDADPLITEHLKNENKIFKIEDYEHDYPFCWRCSAPLLYYAKQSWFIRTTQVKEKLIKNNRVVNWIPAHLKEGRFGEWLKEVKDWSLSRERYWGTPLPIWECGKCGHREVIGSREDLRKQKFSTNRYFLLRHGEAIPNVKNFYCSWPEPKDGPLTPNGRKQIEKLLPKIKKNKIDLIFSSDILRAKQTAEIISKAINVKIKYDERLREIDVGDLNGKNLSEARKYFDPKSQLNEEEIVFKKFYDGFPGGEKYSQAMIRMRNFIKEIEGKYKNKNILIISHDAPLSLLFCSMSGYNIFEGIEQRKKISFKTGELRGLVYKNFPYNKKGELDLHRPHIDEVQFYCFKCGNAMKRVPEVIDCWFDSGAMPFAQAHFPFACAQMQNAKCKMQSLKPPELFPADYISEAIDQTRGWFYTLLAISTLLGFKSPYKNVISLGHILDEKGEKMSKSKGNVVNPWQIIDKSGSDALRWHFYIINQPGESKLFSQKEVEESFRKLILTLWNCCVFYETYAKNGKSKAQNEKSFKQAKIHILDKWILSRFNNLASETTKKLENYDITSAARLIEDFIIDDFSLWYIRRSRKRFQQPQGKGELEKASLVLFRLLSDIIKLTAPFIPFLSEAIYQNLQNQSYILRPKGISGAKSKVKSVHLEDWPRVNKGLIDRSLEEKMAKAREIVGKVLAQRAQNKIKVRQPLEELKITHRELAKNKELLDLIKEEVNVKKITLGKNFELNTKLTPQLIEEGILRDIIRLIQDMRKGARYTPKDKVDLYIASPEAIKKIIIRSQKYILLQTKINAIKYCSEIPSEGYDILKESFLGNDRIRLSAKKVDK